MPKIYGTPEWKDLLYKIKQNASDLIEYNLAGKEIDDDAVKELVEALLVNDTLKCLNLGGNEITGEGAEYLIKALNKNRNLQLKLYENSIDKNPLQKINKALEKNRMFQSEALEKARTLQKADFIYIMSIINEIPLWEKLPLEIKLHVLGFANFHSIFFENNKTILQFNEFIKFISENSHGIHELYKAKKPLKIKEWKKDNASVFQFFQPRPQLKPLSKLFNFFRNYPFLPYSCFLLLAALLVSKYKLPYSPNNKLSYKARY